LVIEVKKKNKNIPCWDQSEDVLVKEFMHCLTTMLLEIKKQAHFLESYNRCCYNQSTNYAEITWNCSSVLYV